MPKSTISSEHKSWSRVAGGQTDTDNGRTAVARAVSQPSSWAVLPLGVLAALFALFAERNAEQPQRLVWQPVAVHLAMQAIDLKFDENRPAAQIQEAPPAKPTKPAPSAKPREPAQAGGTAGQLVELLARKYRTSGRLMGEMVHLAFVAGSEMGLDPMLILALISVESGFNPDAQSPAGAKGLMQIMPEYHMDKLQAQGGAVHDPRTNIRVGASILKEYLQAAAGDLMHGLQLYNGTPRDPNRQFAGRVMAEKERLERAISAEDPGA